MITTDNFKQLLRTLEFTENANIFSKHFDNGDCQLQVDFDNQILLFPTDQGLTVNDTTTCNFSAQENFVVFECVHRLLTQGYHPKHIELEKKWQLGHSQKSGKADICIKDNNDKIILIIECKTAGSEYSKAKNILENDPRNQLFSYLQQASSTQFLALYASDFEQDQLSSEYYLINVQDNDDLLANNKELKGYKDASTSEEKWQVWHDTYEQDYATIGLFENNKAYEIGKKIFSVDDLKTISHKDIQGKYHEFATILRQHNVSGRENAFDKLVNLFLCKVTDEDKNPQQLKFYWKGTAYDDPFDFQDRLQELYKIGMEKFLKDDITYVANKQIDDAFSYFKDKPNETKDIIKKYFKELKFFSNNDFAFIDVHNEKLFKQNFDVLLKITRIFQDIKLTGGEENQFLGDMFEGFLDAGVKQSEGQFFTPMPIVKFIIHSLPDKDKPKVIDYACGAGHFLNEYFVKNPHSSIVGVEKEYRLSKVAKVSSCMYGSDMDIIHNDALAHNDDLENNSFDVLIANPPYSVKGFLTTLESNDRKQYDLIDCIDSKSLQKNNAIECFFIERAKQLLNKDAVAGIIVPSSILNKDTPNLYTKTREMLLQHFYILAIAEFGSGTFGKTGTNTVTLFLRRRDPSHRVDRHYKNMVGEWFKGDLDINKVFKDEPFLADYCAYNDYPLSDYQSFLQGVLTDDLLATEMFDEYQKSFDKWFNKSYKAPKNKEFKKKTADEKQAYKQAIKEKEFLSYVKDKESEKLYFYCLAKSQDNEVIIVKSPSDKNQIKKFLGYEWSNRKGDEGIKYLADTSIEITDDELDQDDKRILENQQGLKYINTALYNPQNVDDESKINKLIKDNFNGVFSEIPDELAEFVSCAKLVDMLDFDRVDFAKTLSLTPKKKIIIESKWDLVKLGVIAEEIFAGGDLPESNEYIKGIKSSNKFQIPIYSNGIQNNGLYGYTNIARVTKPCITISARGTIGFPIIRNEPFYPIIRLLVLIPKEDLCHLKYLKYIIAKLDLNQFGVATPQLSVPQISEFKIPLPPLNIQQQIVDEIEKLEIEEKQANDEIEKLRLQILELASDNNGDKKRLDTICSLRAGTFVKASEINDTHDKNLYACYGGNGLRGYTKTFTNEGLFSLIGRQGALCGNVHLVDGKFHATEHAVVVYPNKDIATVWLHHKLVSMNLNQYATGVAQPGLSVKNLNPIEIYVPPLAEQEKVVKEIETIEQQIAKLEHQLQQIPQQKQAILQKYL